MILLCVGACSPRSEPSVSPPQTQQNRASQPIAGPEFKQRQIAFLNRIRDADPQQRVIDRAMLNDQNELGLILDRSVESEQNPGIVAYAGCPIRRKEATRLQCISLDR